MKKSLIKAAAYGTIFSIIITSAGMDVQARSLSEVLPSAGISYTLGSNSTSLSELLENSLNKDKKEEASADAADKEENKENSETTVLDEIVSDATASGNSTEPELLDKDNLLTENKLTEGAIEEVTEEIAKSITDTVIVSKGYTDDLAQASGAQSEEQGFTNLVIAQVTNYVNVRDYPDEEKGEVVGKLYNNSVGNFLGEENGWYKISSGSVEGYVKGEFCVTGVGAVELAKKVGTRIATVNTTTLYVREEATTDSSVIGMVPIADELIVMEEEDGWVKVNIEEGDGYVSTDYVILSTEFVKAESKAEEEARLAKEAAEREAARAAAAARNKGNKKSESSGKYADTGVYQPAGSGTGANVASFALQFVGNPYVYGGSSLTNGTDCSGFVMSVYKNFGVNLPHSSSADRSVGSTVGSLSEAQAGDIICYSGHVAIYIGNGQIVHASTKSTGIKVSDVSYRSILSIRRIF